jgi:spore coat polysaccharide biosynthesis predicted glycosyltransferase SpsG
MIVFRADVSSQTGLQHLSRCAWLASLLKKNNDVLFCSREDKKTAKFLATRNIPTKFVKDQSAIELAEVKTVIFDLPHFSAPDSALLEKAKKAGVKIIQIIPTTGEYQPVDVCVFPFPGSMPAVPAGTTLMPGAEYALLHHKFRHFNQARRKYHKNIKNIFINLGDMLPYRELRQTIDTLHRLHLKMKIAPGLNLRKADKRNLMKIYPGIHFCGRSESPARAYFEADLALVPAGAEALEAAAVGTPALYFYQEPGQEALAAIWTDLQAGLKFGKLEDLTSDSFRDTIAPLTPERREAMGISGRKLVDGLGVRRFFKILHEHGLIN